MCAASTAVWTGIPLRVILEDLGVKVDQAHWVNFNGPPGELPNGTRN
jgi:DMSO/TMAO reductase YedYZ molybdopterin-dependent catalytic subunit